MGAKLDKPQVLYVGLSLFILFHLTSVLLSGNPDSIIARQLFSVTSPYVNQFGLGSTWRFFSPNPLTTFIEYEVLNDQILDSDEEMKVQTWPPTDLKGITRHGYNRRLGNSMFFSATENSKSQFLVPWLCRKHSEAQSISIRIATIHLESLERAQLRNKSLKDLAKVRRTYFVKYPCEAQE